MTLPRWRGVSGTRSCPTDLPSRGRRGVQPPQCRDEIPDLGVEKRHPRPGEYFETWFRSQEYLHGRRYTDSVSLNLRVFVTRSLTLRWKRPFLRESCLVSIRFRQTCGLLFEYFSRRHTSLWCDPSTPCPRLEPQNNYSKIVHLEKVDVHCCDLSFAGCVFSIHGLFRSQSKSSSN